MEKHEIFDNVFYDAKNDCVVIYYPYQSNLEFITIKFSSGDVQRTAFRKYVSKVDIFDLYIDRFRDFWRLIE